MTAVSLLRCMIYSALLTLTLTPFVFPVANRLGAVDIPRDRRRMHRRPTPRLGGLPVFLSVLFLTVLYAGEQIPTLFYSLCGALLIVLVGVLDDEMNLSPLLKFSVQTAAVLISFMGIQTPIGVGSTLLLLVFRVALINAHNFIDGIDGLCAGVSLAEGIAIGLTLALADDPLYAVLSFLLAGSAIGFLPYNLKKGGASLFLGDTGSTFYGFMLPVSALRVTTSPLLLFLFFALPLTDLAVAVLRRLSRGKSPFLSDRSHLHHLLSDKLGKKRAAGLLCLLSALGALTAFILS